MTEPAGARLGAPGQRSRPTEYQPDPSDLIALDARVHLDGVRLIDDLTGRVLELTERGAGIVASFDGRPLAAIEAAAASERITGTEVRRVVQTLERDGLVKIDRPLDLRPLLAGVIPAWRRGRAPARRYPPTLRGTMAAALRVSWLSISAAAAVPLLFLAPAGPRVAWGDLLIGALPIAALTSIISVTAVLSVAMHEHGHLAMMRRHAVPFAGLIRRGWRLSIRYRRPHDPGTRRAVAVAGPLAGAATALPCATATGALGFGTQPTLAIAAIGAIHLLSLLPFFADGRELWQLEAPQ